MRKIIVFVDVIIFYLFIFKYNQGILEFILIEMKNINQLLSVCIFLWNVYQKDFWVVVLFKMMY